MALGLMRSGRAGLGLFVGSGGFPLASSRREGAMVDAEPLTSGSWSSPQAANNGALMDRSGWAVAAATALVDSVEALTMPPKKVLLVLLALIQTPSAVG